jgi:hypothetical protein
MGDTLRRVEAESKCGQSLTVEAASWKRKPWLLVILHNGSRHYPSARAYFVAMDTTPGALNETPNVFAHELGHFLGPAPIDKAAACGAELGPFGLDNLMHPGAGSKSFIELTPAPDRARTCACLPFPECVGHVQRSLCVMGEAC